MYVVNSGWQVDGYDNRLIVIDAATLEIEKEYEIAVNMTKIVADDYGVLWIISNGDYNTIPASLYAFDTNTNTFTNTNISAAAMTVCGDSLYFYNSSYDPVTWAATFNYGIINVKSKSKISDKIITDGTESAITTPYCIAVNPTTRDIFITDCPERIFDPSFFNNHATPLSIFDFSASFVKISPGSYKVFSYSSVTIFS